MSVGVVDVGVAKVGDRVKVGVEVKVGLDEGTEVGVGVGLWYSYRSNDEISVSSGNSCTPMQRPNRN